MPDAADKLRGRSATRGRRARQRRRGGRVSLLVSATPGAVERGVKAGAIVKAAAQVVGGGGGGRDTMAQAGGRDPTKLREALETARAEIARALGVGLARRVTGRVIALDYGSARCGVAVSDPTGTLATPLEPSCARTRARASTACSPRSAARRPRASWSGCRCRSPGADSAQTTRGARVRRAARRRLDVRSSSTTSASPRRSRSSARARRGGLARRRGAARGLARGTPTR